MASHKTQVATDYVGLKVHHERFYDEKHLESEIDRVFEICNGCRMCFKFCESFPIMFRRLDDLTEKRRELYLAENPEIAERAAARRKEIEARAAETAADKHGLEYAEEAGDELPELSAKAHDLSKSDIAEIVDHCFQCKLCYVECPYTPDQGHAFALDFPRLLLRYKAIEARKNGIPFFKQLMTNTDRMGRLAGAGLAPVINMGNTNKLNRALMEKAMGIHREKLLPSFALDTFPKWWMKGNRPTNPAPKPAEQPLPEGTKKPVVRRIALFSTCIGNYNHPKIARAATAVLEHNGCEVVWPSSQMCCGMPFCDSGDMEGALSNMEANVASLYPFVEQGYQILTLEPSCGLMLRKEYPQLADGTGGELERRTKAVAAAVKDIHEYLFELKREKTIKREFTHRFGKVKYHVPCHLRAQNIGYRSRDILSMFCEDVEAVAECSAHDGTWSMDKRYFDESLKYGAKLFNKLKDGGCDHSCTDCSLAGNQIKQGANLDADHPIVMLARAYGLQV